MDALCQKKLSRPIQYRLVHICVLIINHIWANPAKKFHSQPIKITCK